MAKLGTKDIKASGGGLPKTLQPGNAVCKLNGIELEEFKFKEGGLHIVLNLEGIPLGDGFEGFLIDKDKPAGPKHLGQVGAVKASEWAFADGETKTGIAIVRDQEILKFMKNLCVALDKVKWLDDQDNKHDTIESLVAAFNKAKPFKDIFLDFCICGKEYTNKNNFTSYELFLPKFNKTGVPFAAILSEEEVKKGKTSKIVIFKAEDHIKKKKVDATVSSFEADPAIAPGESATDPAFDLD